MGPLVSKNALKSMNQRYSDLVDEAIRVISSCTLEHNTNPETIVRGYKRQNDKHYEKIA